MTKAPKHKLIIMRHAKSDWSVPVSSDFDRPLTRRGNKDAPRMGTWLVAQGLVPDLIVSSPAMRTRQTVLHVVESFRIPELEIIWEQALYLAALDTLLAEISKYASRAGCLMLVGHNPGMDSLVDYLSDRPPGYRDGKLMTTAAVAVLDYSLTGKAAQEHGARLEQLVRPKDLGK